MTRASSNPTILVVGSSNVDFIMSVDRLPAVGETVTGGAFFQTFGGKGANQALAAARAGGAVTFLTALGEDVYAPIIRENLASEGIDVSHVRIEPGTGCGCALIMFDRDGNNYLTVAPGANYRLTPEHLEPLHGLFAEAGMVIVQMETSLPAIARALEMAHSAGVVTMLNFAPARVTELPSPGEWIDILIVNEIEAAVLSKRRVSDLNEAASAAANLRELGPGTVIVTLGADGAWVSSADFEGHVPAFEVQAVDTTAAGDTFCGALAVALVEGQSKREATAFASAASAISVGRVGAQPSIPSRQEIVKFLQAREI